MTPQQWALMLRMAVKNKGISWAELARETPISSSCLMKMKRGERIISLEVAERLANALDMPALSLGVIDLDRDDARAGAVDLGRVRTVHRIRQRRGDAREA